MIMTYCKECGSLPKIKEQVSEHMVTCGSSFCSNSWVVFGPEQDAIIKWNQLNLLEV